MNSKQSKDDSTNINFNVVTKKVTITQQVDFVIYVSKLIETHLANVINEIARRKSEEGGDLNRLIVSLELIQLLVKEIHIKVPESFDNSYIFGGIPIFEDEKSRLEHLHKVLTLNSMASNRN